MMERQEGECSLPRDWGGVERSEDWLLSGDIVSVLEDAASVRGRGDGGTTVHTHLMPLTCTLRCGCRSLFVTCVLTTSYKRMKKEDNQEYAIKQIHIKCAKEMKTHESHGHPRTFVGSTAMRGWWLPREAAQI